MTIQYQQQGNIIVVTGKTYPVREAIKALGGRFDATQKTWQIPYSQAALAQLNTLTNAPQSIAPQPTPLYSQTTEPSNEPTFADIKSEGLTVSQLMATVQRAVSQAFPAPVWVIGEVQNLNRRPQGFYLTLAEAKEDDAGEVSSRDAMTVAATIWRQTHKAIALRHGEELLESVLAEGMKVRMLCQVSLYEGRGTISLNVLDIDPSFTKGALALAREKLLKELRQKGLADANKRLHVSPFPFLVGLITADNSRAQSDFLHQLEEGRFPGSVVFRATPMQGEGVPLAVARAIAELSAAGCDVIVITRGGGSAADLRWFDAPEIAYAIARSSRPIVAAIGHHDDFCIAEEIAFCRRKTPTAAADFIIEVFAKTAERVRTAAHQLAHLLALTSERTQQHMVGLTRRLERAALDLCQRKETRLSDLVKLMDRQLMSACNGLDQRLLKASGALHASANRNINQLETQLQSLAGTMHLGVTRNASQLENQLSTLAGQIESRDPRPWLSKGWTQLSSRGKGVRSIREVKLGDVVAIPFYDGRLEAKVTAITGPKEPMP